MLRGAIEEQYREQIFDWAEKNLDPERYTKITKIDFSKMKGIDEMVEHIMNKHEAKFTSSTKFNLNKKRFEENELK